MKTIKCTSHFKAVTNKASANLGKKRETLQWEFDSVEVEDLQAMDITRLEEVAQVLESALEAHGRTVLLKAAEDWSFTPTGKVSIAALVQFLNTETSRSRVVTKETLELAALWYQANCGMIGKPVESGLAGASVIRAKLAPIAGNAQALKIMGNNLVSLFEACIDSDDVEVLASTQTVSGVIDWLTKTSDGMIQESETDFSSAL